MPAQVVPVDLAGQLVDTERLIAIRYFRPVVRRGHMRVRPDLVARMHHFVGDLQGRLVHPFVDRISRVVRVLVLQHAVVARPVDALAHIVRDGERPKMRLRWADVAVRCRPINPPLRRLLRLGREPHFQLHLCALAPRHALQRMGRVPRFRARGQLERVAIIHRSVRVGIEKRAAAELRRSQVGEVWCHAVQIARMIVGNLHPPVDPVVEVVKEEDAGQRIETAQAGVGAPHGRA